MPPETLARGRVGSFGNVSAHCIIPGAFDLDGVGIAKIVFRSHLDSIKHRRPSGECLPANIISE